MRLRTLIYIAFALGFLYGLISKLNGQEGKQATCDNYYNTPKSQRCECAKANSCDKEKWGDDYLGGKDGYQKCGTYCRRNDCKCVNPCTSKIHKKTTIQFARKEPMCHK